MAVDRYGNTAFKKDFWADGGWLTAFVLLPLLIGWVFMVLVLIYGVYATFRFEPDRLQAGFFFLLFACLGAAIAMLFAKSVITLFAEKIVFTDERVIYVGFGSYSLPYGSIKRLALSERAGPFGKERALFFVSEDNANGIRMYPIPRWRTFAGGVFSRELSERTKLSLLDRNLLSFYVPLHGRERWLSVILSVSASAIVVIFFAARAAADEISSLAVFLWFLIALFLLFVFLRYLGRKREAVVLSRQTAVPY